MDSCPVLGKHLAHSIHSVQTVFDIMNKQIRQKPCCFSVLSLVKIMYSCQGTEWTSLSHHYDRVPTNLKTTMLTEKHWLGGGFVYHNSIVPLVTGSEEAFTLVLPFICLKKPCIFFSDMTLALSFISHV